MEEKRYPILDEEEHIGACSESAVAEPYYDVEELTPPLLGPATLEEALKALDESEKEFNEGKCIPWEDVISDITRRYPAYAY